MDKKTVIERLIRDAHEKGGFTGTWLYAEKGEIVSKGAVGFRDAENTVPMREDSIFDIASVSKQFPAAAIMLLRRRKLLRRAGGNVCPHAAFKRRLCNGR